MYDVTYVPDVEQTPPDMTGMHPNAEDTHTVYYKGYRLTVYHSPLDPWVVYHSKSNVCVHEDGTLQACLDAIANGVFNKAELPPRLAFLTDD